VQRGDGGLQHVLPAATSGQSAVELGPAVGDLLGVPPGPILIVEQLTSQ
jgi:hypothetical protein